jgi:prephenate dehydratase
MTDPDYSTHSANIAQSTLPTDIANQLDRTLTIGIQGGKGSFNEEAVQHYLKESGVTEANVQYLYTSDNVVDAVVRGEVDYGQCAIYNSVGGYVEETTNALENAPVKIVREFEIKIAHAIMIRPDQDFSKVDTVMCHPQVLAQCKSNLKNKYPHLRQTSGEGEYVDNAKTAEALAQRILPDNTAVMGSKILASIYGLQVVEDNLQDAEQNYTRFIHVVKI